MVEPDGIEPAGLWPAFIDRRFYFPVDLNPNHIEMVEPDGIEPTTSCLQSRRSPN